MKRKALLGSLLGIVASATLVVGSTYALFTSEAKANVAIQSGTVKVSADVSDIKMYSGNWNAVSESYEYTLQENGMFANGGSASYDEESQTFTLDKLTPMDKIEFTVNVNNESNVAIKYRSVFKKVEDTGLFAGLKISLDDEVLGGEDVTSKWTKTSQTGKIATTKVVVELPDTGNDAYDNQFQGLSCEFLYSIEAVQGNLITDDEENPDVPEETDQEKVDRIANAFVFDKTEADADFVLTTDAGEEVAISWASDKEGSIKVEGANAKVTQSLEDANVTLTATFTYNEASATKTYNVKVLKREKTDAEKLADAVAAFSFNKTEADADFTLPTAVAGHAGVGITWKSMDESAIKVEGANAKVTRHMQDATVTLKATFELNEESTTKEYNVKVLALTDQQKVDAVAAKFTIEQNNTSVTSDFVLPLTAPLNEEQIATLSADEETVAISWASDKEDSITIDGANAKVTQSLEDVDVTLTATFTYNEVSATNEYKVTVEKREKTDAEKLADAVAAFSFNKTEADANFALPTAVVDYDGVEITWKSNNAAIVVNGANATVTRGDADVDVTLEATFTLNEASTTKTYNVTVLKREKTDAEILDEAVATFSFDKAEADADFDLPDTIADYADVTITWASNNAAIVVNGANATVTRGDADVDVTLTATFKYGTAEDVTKTYTVKVLKQEKTDEKQETVLAEADLSKVSFGTTYEEKTKDIDGYNFTYTIGGNNNKLGANDKQNGDTNAPGHGVTSLPSGWTTTTEGLDSYARYYRLTMNQDFEQVTEVSWSLTPYDTVNVKLVLFESTDEGSNWHEVAITDLPATRTETTVSYTPLETVAKARYAIVIVTNSNKANRTTPGTVTIKGYK